MVPNANVDTKMAINIYKAIQTLFDKRKVCDHLC